MYSSPPAGRFSKNGKSDDEQAREDVPVELDQGHKHQVADVDELDSGSDDVLFGNTPVDIPEAYKKTALEVRSPLAMHIATPVTAALSVNPMSTVFKPV